MEQFFLTVLNMSGTGAVVICAVLLLRLLLKRAPKKYSYWLWLVAGFRLLCPVSWRSVFSIFSLAPASAVVVVEQASETAASVSAPAASAIEYVPSNIGLMAEPKVSLPVPALSEAVNEVLPAATPLDSVNPMQVWLLIGAVIWMAGIAVMLAWGVVSYLRVARRLRTATRLDGNLWQSEAVGSPFILGFLRPRIYLPYGLEGERLDCVLAHERYHLARRDDLVKLLAFLILALHWFNPLVWLGFYCLSRDMELRCDEAVLGRTPAKPTDYSETLLSFAVGGRFPRPGPLAFGETGVKARIKNALRWKEPRFWVTCAAAILVSLGIVACAANPTGTMSDAALRADAWTAVSGAKDAAGVQINEHIVELERGEDGTTVTVAYPITGEVYRSPDEDGAERVTVKPVEAPHDADNPRLTVTYHFDPADLRTPLRAEVELTGPTPWVWTHTVKSESLSGVKRTMLMSSYGFPLTEPQLAAVCAALSRVPADAVYPGRGFPARDTVTLTDAEGRVFTLAYADGYAVLSFDDETAKKWPIDPENPAPSWEVHDAALSELLENLTEETDTDAQTTDADAPMGTGEAARLQFPDALRQQIVEDWKNHDMFSSQMIGSAYRYFDEWADACAWAGFAPENPLEDELVWLIPKNTAGTDVLLYGERDHAAAYAQGDANGNPESLSLEAGYAFAFGDVRVVFTAVWNADGGTPIFNGAATVYGASAGVIEFDGSATVYGTPASVTEDEGERYLARALSYQRGIWLCGVRLISNSKDESALDDCWTRLMNLYAAPLEIRAELDDTEDGSTLAPALLAELLEWGRELARADVEAHDKFGRSLEFTYRIQTAAITGLTRIETGTAALDHDIVMYQLEYRLLADHPDRVLLAGGMQRDGDWLTEECSMGHPYLVLLHDAKGWTRLGVAWSGDMIRAPELLEPYGGNPYTAACMMLYQQYLQERESPDLLAGLPDFHEGDDFTLRLLSPAADNPDGLHWDQVRAVENAWSFHNALGQYDSLNLLRWRETERPDAETLRAARWVVQLETANWGLGAWQGVDAVCITDVAHGSRWFLPELEFGELVENLVYLRLRAWYDEAEWNALLDETPCAVRYGVPIVLPDRELTPEQAAQTVCDGNAALSLRVSEGSMFRNSYAKAVVEGYEPWNERFDESGYADGQQWRFLLYLIFVPENETALRYQMAGNTHKYTGTDLSVPAGAYECTRCGYAVREADGWHVTLTGTSW
ncbi:MAG: hypothetical protein IJR65_04500 [Oscillospiraceae bacterium]|nr:hypothetical protein [Oscillospiraceae bacterium]